MHCKSYCLERPYLFSSRKSGCFTLRRGWKTLRRLLIYCSSFIFYLFKDVKMFLHVCHAVLTKLCVFFFLLELLFLENAVNRSDIGSFSFACYNRTFGLPGDFSVAFLYTLEWFMWIQHWKNVKNSAISGLGKDFHLVIRKLTPYIIAIMYLLFSYIQSKQRKEFDELWKGREVCLVLVEWR